MNTAHSYSYTTSDSVLYCIPFIFSYFSFLVFSEDNLDELAENFINGSVESSITKAQRFFSDEAQYMWYAQCLKNHCNAVDGTFYDTINLNSRI